MSAIRKDPGPPGTPQAKPVLERLTLLTPAEFEVRNVRSAEAVIIEVRGEIDMATVPRLAEAIDSVQVATRCVVVDLSEVSFLDSSGLKALLCGQRDLAEWEIDFRLVCPADGAARKALDVTDLIGQLSVAETLDAALA